MSMIFGSFPTREHAETFVADVFALSGLSGEVFDTVEAAQEADPFPFALTAPVVHVERTEDEREEAVARMVGSYGGVYAGT